MKVPPPEIIGWGARKKKDGAAENGRLADFLTNRRDLSSTKDAFAVASSLRRGSPDPIQEAHVRWLVAFGALSFSSVVFAQTVPLKMTCTGSDAQGNSIYLITDDDGSLVEQRDIENKNGEFETVEKTLAKKISLRKTSKADMHDVVGDNDQAVLTLKHDGLPGTRSAQGSNGKILFRCEINQNFITIESPRTMNAFCQMGRTPGAVQRLLMDSSNRLAFPNGPYGLKKGGVCWWHNLFERNAAYLAVYQPKSAKPDRATGVAIINAIRAGHQVVAIPGYKNLQSFSADYRTEIIAMLENWQIADGIGGSWILGLSGRSEVAPAELRKIMDDTYMVVEQRKQIAFHMLQIPGIDSHAWLVLGMKRTANGYDLYVADSNMLATRRVQFRDGMTKLPEYNAVPYLQSRYLSQTNSMIEIAAQTCAGR